MDAIIGRQISLVRLFSSYWRIVRGSYPRARGVLLTKCALANLFAEGLDRVVRRGRFTARPPGTPPPE